ncbi:transporter, partial [Curtobacterium sp. PsM8]|nr:transporter [Curtobacterium sp. PsM8]
EVEFGEVHAFVGQDFFQAVVQAAPRGPGTVPRARPRMSGQPGRGTAGSPAPRGGRMGSVVGGDRPGNAG